jgi:small-conductance mechanosensitive channel
VTVQVPLDTDLEAVRTLLREAAQDERAEVVVTELGDKATVRVSVWAPDEPSAERLEHELLLRSHARLREAGVFA